MANENRCVARASSGFETLGAGGLIQRVIGRGRANSDACGRCVHWNCDLSNDPIRAMVMRKQREAFVAYFGRKPRLHDAIFFCWHFRSTSLRISARS